MGLIEVGKKADMKRSILCLKASSKAELVSMVRAARGGSQPLAAPTDGARLSFAYSGAADLKAKLERAEVMLASNAGFDQSGIYYQTLDRPPCIAFLYPGQGSQTVNMLGGLRSALPEFEGHLLRLDSLYRMVSDESLLALIYTTPGREAEERLRDTRNAQPALGVIETALRLSLEDIGVRAHLHAGHSYGELPALCGAGLLDEPLLMKLSLERGNLLADAGRKAPGGMMALAASREDVETLCGGVDGSLEIVNINSPRQLVVAGPFEAIVRLEEAARRSGIPARRLNTSCAFHSALMAPVAPQWRRFLRRTLAKGLPSPTAQVFSNVTARPHTAPEEMAELLEDQIIKPVRWAEICANLLNLGANIFIEVGPGRVLSDLMKENSAGHPPLILAADPLAADGDQHLGNLLARLAAAGVDLHWERFADESALVTRPSRPSVANSESNFFEANRDIVERYFTQQAALLELSLRNAPAAERSTLTQSALAANQKVISDFLAAHESVARFALTGGGVGIPPEAKPRVRETADDFAGANRSAAAPPQRPPHAGDLPARVEAELRRAISDATGFPPESIDRGHSFKDLGIDSLSMAEIWSEVANRVPEVAAFVDRVYEIRSLADVAVLCAKQLDGPTEPSPDSSGTCLQCLPACPEPSTPSTQDSSGRFQNWSTVRSRLVGAISAARGIAISSIGSCSDFERDLGLDVFTREKIFRKHLLEHPRFGQAGAALLNARNLSELDRLLERFDNSAAQANDDANDQPNSVVTVERFVLREEPIDLNARESQLPADVLLAACAPSPEVDRLRYMFTRRGISVSAVYVDREFPVDPPMTDSRQIVFLAEGDPDSTALFVLAKALWGGNVRQHKITRMTILGSDTYGPEARGAVGVARSLRRELPETAIRTVWARSAVPGLSENLLLAALFSPQLEGDVRISGDRMTREILKRTRKPAEPRLALNLGPDSRILVLGGGDGISAEIAIGLSESYACEIIAVGRTPWPGSLPHPQIQAGPQTVQLLKRAILEELSAEAPRRAEDLQQRWKLVSRQRALWSTKTRIEAAGGRFSYHAVDVTDDEAFSNAIRSIQSAGPIHGVIHGAGIVCDNLLPGKSVEEFRAVVRTKAVPATLLRQLLETEPLEFVFFLSSMTSYTGTAGQTDYAAANEILNAAAREWNRHSPYPVKSLLWSVWTETGLASAVLKRYMTKLGLAGIPTAEGVSLLINELIHGHKPEDCLLFAPPSTLQYSMQPPKAPPAHLKESRVQPAARNADSTSTARGHALIRTI